MKECKFNFGRSQRVIHGGPYRERPSSHVGVKMAVEIDHPHDISVPTRDFSVPKQHHMEEGIRKVLKPLALNEPVYVGCMGGIGRTGLFLACLAKTLGEDQPVKYIRKNYIPHAVETSQQENFVRTFNHELFAPSLTKYYWAAWVVDKAPYSWVKKLTARLLNL
jgi:Predicted protein-tyrosine phosphatase